ncbi:hypothetical protein IF2G_02034 [Cordyceps javanica]|nr:hypothetical protein IF2G_02034 [Cordyceps javanica]
MNSCVDANLAVLRTFRGSDSQTEVSHTLSAYHPLLAMDSKQGFPRQSRGILGQPGLVRVLLAGG